MQLIEVGLTISDYADYMVGSEQTEPGEDGLMIRLYRSFI